MREHEVQSVEEKVLEIVRGEFHFCDELAEKQLRALQQPNHIGHLVVAADVARDDERDGFQQAVQRFAVLQGERAQRLLPQYREDVDSVVLRRVIGQVLVLLELPGDAAEDVVGLVFDFDGSKIACFCSCSF